MPAKELIEKLRTIVGAHGLLTDKNDVEPYVHDWRGIYVGETALVVRPANTAEVAAVVKACAESRTSIVPQGGNTGMCMAAVPRVGRDEIVLSLGRMNRIREIDPLNNTLTADAGAVLASIQQAAAEVDRLFPLSLGAEGSCTIGGNLSTNAGGTGAVAYGIARDLVLGLEVVLADGRIMNLLSKLKKNNTGYDLRHIFVGAEGTLGIITAAVVKLFPRPRAIAGMSGSSAVPSTWLWDDRICSSRVDPARGMPTIKMGSGAPQPPCLESTSAVNCSMLRSTNRVRFWLANGWYVRRSALPDA